MGFFFKFSVIFKFGVTVFCFVKRMYINCIKNNRYSVSAVNFLLIKQYNKIYKKIILIKKTESFFQILFFPEAISENPNDKLNI